MTCFTEAGAPRNACLQVSKIGHVHLQLGFYARAEGLLREALSIAESMGLSFASMAMIDLGDALALAGEVRAAIAIERLALDRWSRTGTRAGRLRRARTSG